MKGYTADGRVWWVSYDRSSPSPFRPAFTIQRDHRGLLATVHAAEPHIRHDHVRLDLRLSALGDRQQPSTASDWSVSSTTTASLGCRCPGVPRCTLPGATVTDARHGTCHQTPLGHSPTVYMAPAFRTGRQNIFRRRVRETGAEWGCLGTACARPAGPLVQGRAHEARPE